MTTMLLFDGDCRFSSTAARTFQRVARPDCLVLPYQQVDLERWQVEQSLAAAQVVFVRREEPSVDVKAGAAAIAGALGTCPFPGPAAAAVLRLPLVAQAAQAAYRVVAANRYRLPGGAPASDLDRTEDAVGAQSP